MGYNPSPSNLDESTRLYLKPLGLGPKGQAGAFPLAGGWISFQSVQVILVTGEQRIYDAPYPVESLDNLKKNLPKALSQNLDATLENLTASRPAIGGLSFKVPKLMGILNVTPDSFSDGGDHNEDAEARARQIFAEGADILDVGAESTRPGADEVPVEEELQRLEPVFKSIKKLPGPVSIDTRKARVMEKGVEQGAAFINDVSALGFDKDAIAAAKKAKGVILMHAKGTPADMQKDPTYKDVVLEVYNFLEARIQACLKAGIAKGNLIVDPGIGFGKTLSHNLALLKDLNLFQGLGVPILTGVSRKRFIGEITGIENPKDRLSGSLSASLFAVSQGAQVIRCHDVREMRQALDVYQSITSFG